MFYFFSSHGTIWDENIEDIKSKYNHISTLIPPILSKYLQICLKNKILTNCKHPLQGWGWQDWHWGVPTAVQQEVKLANIKKEEKLKSVQQEVNVIKIPNLFQLSDVVSQVKIAHKMSLFDDLGRPRVWENNVWAFQT